MPETLLLIDGPAHLYRSFYAIKALTDPQGRPVNAVYGFAQILLNLLDQVKPTHAAVAFDTPAPTHRHRQYAEYKAHREAIPEDLKAQLPVVKELIARLGFTILEAPGWEADDLIGTLTDQARAKAWDVAIFTTDKDAFQLVAPGVTVLRPVRGGKGEIESLDAEGVERVFGVPPERVVDVLALMGDASDNVPGVPGIGEKTALDLVRQLGPVEKVYAALDEVARPKVREALRAHRAEADLSKSLVTLDRQAPVQVDLGTLHLPATLPESGLHMLADLGFKSLLLRRAAAPAAQAPAADWTTGLNAQADLAAVLAAAQRTGWLAVELSAHGAAWAADGRAAAWTPFPEGGLEAFAAARGPWADALADERIAKVSYDLKPLLRAGFRHGLAWRGRLEDLHIAAHLLDLPAGRRDDWTVRLLGGPVPPDRPALAACATQLLYKSLLARVEEAGAQRVYREVELPLLPVLARMEAAGVAIDPAAISDMSIRLGGQADRLEKEVQAKAGTEFNVRSTQQLAEVLFERLKLSAGKKTKTGRSTSVEVLESLANEHPVPAMILEYRQLQKLKSTYLDVLPGLADPADGRVHTTFNQVGAATGRLSSSDPNLQNIPIRTELGRELRRAFVPAKASDSLLSADYSQIELRLLAHLSGDQRMLADFAAGVDIHSATASEIFHVPLDAVTPEMRRQAKVCNFGIAYGVSPYGLSRQLGIPPARGREFIDRFFLRYPCVQEFLQQTIAQARESGYVSTLLGRRRAVPDLRSANRNIREGAERAAINTPVQGSAADLIKLAMVKVSEVLERERLTSRMILQVHDELVFEGPEAEMPVLAERVTAAMTRIYPLRVALEVTVAWGRNWMEAHG